MCSNGRIAHTRTSYEYMLTRISHLAQFQFMPENNNKICKVQMEML